MKTNSNVVMELSMTMSLQEARTLRKLLAQITQGVAPSLEASEIEIIKIFNKEVGNFVEACKGASS